MVAVEANKAVRKIDDVKMHYGNFWDSCEKDFSLKSFENKNEETIDDLVGFRNTIVVLEVNLSREH